MCVLRVVVVVVVVVVVSLGVECKLSGWQNPMAGLACVLSPVRASAWGF